VTVTEVHEPIAPDKSKLDAPRRKRRYVSGHIARRRRSPNEMGAVRQAIIATLKELRPQTVRQVFYQLVARAVVDKTENEYTRTVCRLLGDMRLDGTVPWDHIIDDSRRTRNTQTFDNITDALRDTAECYRRSALRESDVYIEIWSEKDALSGIIWEAASEYDVPVVVSKGMPSLTQIHDSFVNIARAAKAGKRSSLYQFGDHDPTGCLIPETIKTRLREFCNKHGCPYPTFERIALTRDQVERFNLPTRPTKRDGNHHARGFEGDSVELDALPADELRRLVTECIERHISPQQVDVLREAEASERDILQQLAWDHSGE
jgi:hypothetical protein